MYDLKYEVLEYLYNMPLETAMLVDILSIDVSNCDKRYWAVKDLASARQIRKLPSDPDRYCITNLGLRAFLEENWRREKEARKRRNKSSRWFPFILQFALWFVAGWVTGNALIELIELVCN